MVLIALAKNGPSKAVTSSAFIKKYSLQSASTVQSALRGLLEKDFVTLQQGVYTVYDIFMAAWLLRNY